MKSKPQGPKWKSNPQPSRLQPDALPLRHESLEYQPVLV